MISDAECPYGQSSGETCVDISSPYSTPKTFSQSVAAISLTWGILIGVNMACGTGRLSYTAIHDEMLKTVESEDFLITPVYWSVGAAVNPGAGIMSGIFFSYLMDGFGRTATMIISLAWLVIGMNMQIGTVWVKSVWMLIIGRWVHGVGKSMAANAMYVYVREVSPTTQRATWLTAALAFRNTGVAFELLLGIPDALGNYQYWLWLLCVPQMFAVVALVCCVIVPDTPVQLTRSGMGQDKVQRSMHFYFDGHNIDVLEKSPRRAGLVEFLKNPQYKLHLFVAICMTTSIIFSSFVPAEYFTQVIAFVGAEHGDTARIAAGISWFIPVVSIIGGILADRYGRLPVLHTVVWSQAVCLLAIVITLYTGPHPTWVIDLMVAFAAVWLSFGMGIYSPLKLILGEIVSYEYRSAIYGIWQITCTFASVTAVMPFYPMELAQKGAGFLFIFVFFFGFGMVALWLIPETKNRDASVASEYMQRRFDKLCSCIRSQHDDESQITYVLGSSTNGTQNYGTLRNETAS